MDITNYHPRWFIFFKLVRVVLSFLFLEEMNLYEVGLDFIIFRRLVEDLQEKLFTPITLIIFEQRSVTL